MPETSFVRSAGVKVEVSFAPWRTLPELKHGQYTSAWSKPLS